MTKKIRRLLVWRFIRVFSQGITTSGSYSVRNNIRLMNLVLAISIFAGIIVCILFLALSYYLQAAASLINTAGLLYSFHLSKSGKNFSAKFFTTIFTNTCLLAWCCIFTHSSNLATYFLFMATVCIFLYTSKERKWGVFSVTFSLLCFLAESSPVKNYMPALNILTDPEELNLTNWVLSAGLMIILVGEVSVFVFFAEKREKKLSNIKQSLIASRKQLRYQNEDLKVFGAAASHSLQTPISVINVFVSKLKNNLQPESISNAQYYHVIDSCLQQMGDFVKGLFSYYAILDIQTKKETIVIADELQLLKEMLTEKYPGTKILIPDSNATLYINRLLITIIMQNLIENAVKYNEALCPLVRITFLSSKEYFSIRVEDNGIGIKADYQERIFKPFVRINNEKREIPGSGLGLAGAKRAAESINAKLYCESSSPAGSVFRLDILNSTDKNTDR